MPLGMKLLLFVWSPLSMVPLVLVLAGVHVPQPLSYAWHKALHVIGAVVFVGNILTQAVWLGGAQATKSAAAVRGAYAALETTDRLFMGPGMFLLVANGALLAQTWGGIQRWSWMLAALVLFGLFGVVSGPLMWVQIKSLRVLKTTPDEKLLEAMAVASGKSLPVWLVPMLLLPLAIVVLMVVKPRLW